MKLAWTFLLFLSISASAQVYKNKTPITVSCDASKNQKVFTTLTDAEAYAKTCPCVGRTWLPNGYFECPIVKIPPVIKPPVDKPIEKPVSFSFNDSTLTKIDSNNAIQFTYPAGVFWSEQRFTLGDPLPEIWIKYHVQVPANFKHNTKSPCNNKLFALWMDDYSAKGKGPTVIWEFWCDGKGGSKLAMHYSEGNMTAAGVHLQEKPFIAYPTDQGRWMQILLHVRSGKDGLIETSRKWDDEKEFAKLHSVTGANLQIPKDGPAGWKAGYFMGWSNPSYAATTIWNINNIQFSDKPL